MMVTTDFRQMRRDGPQVTLTMTMTEFRETVEWLEMVDPHDAATKDWRAELDRVDPAPSLDADHG